MREDSEKRRRMQGMGAGGANFEEESEEEKREEEEERRKEEGRGRGKWDRERVCSSGLCADGVIETDPWRAPPRRRRFKTLHDSSDSEGEVIEIDGKPVNAG